MSLDVYLEQDGQEVYSANITHNLNEMAQKVSELFYKTLWRPEEVGFIKASDIIVELRKGASRLVCAPTYFKQFNASNGWGSYDNFVPFIISYIEACEKFPNATVKVSR